MCGCVLLCGLFVIFSPFCLLLRQHCGPEKPGHPGVPGPHKSGPINGTSPGPPRDPLGPPGTPGTFKRNLRVRKSYKNKNKANRLTLKKVAKSMRTIISPNSLHSFAYFANLYINRGRILRWFEKCILLYPYLEYFTNIQNKAIKVYIFQISVKFCTDWYIEYDIHNIYRRKFN